MEHSHQHFHHMMAAKRDPVPDLTTDGGQVLSIVYVTAQPTFTGVIGGYSTLTSDSGGNTQQSIFNSAPSTSQAAPEQTQAFSSSQQESFSQGSSTYGVIPSQLENSFSSAAPTTFFTATSAVGSGNTNTAIAGASSTSSSDSTTSTASSGMSVGAKAGLAIGIIAIIGIIAAVLLWFLGKKKREQESYSRTDDEKTTFGAGSAPVPVSAASTTPSANAPRLSLRPVSRMMAEFMGPSKTRLSHGNMLNVINENGSVGAGMGRNLTPSPQPLPPSPMERRLEERPHPNNPFNDPQNPFADPEKPIPPPVERLSPPVKSVKPAPPMAPPALRPAPPPAAAGAMAPSANGMNLEFTATAAAAGIAGAAAATAATRAPQHRPERRPEHHPEDFAVKSVPRDMPRDAPRDMSREAPRDAPRATNPVTAPAPVVAQGPGPEAPPGGNVYRVLMDFKPSMEDELELISGQLVRLLHEYDDGWALCIKLDRSQQGVVPRTCLAAKPSKPKPSHLNQYARGPNGTGPPQMRPGPNGRMSPAMGRPMSPAGGPAGRMNMTPPHSATGPNFNSPRQGPPNGSPRVGQQQQHQRPMSPGAFNQPPRPLSPGPRPQQKRSMSPGPYGANGPPPMAGANQRRRSNSAGALNVRDRRNSPPGPSKLGPGNPIYRSQSPGIAM